MVKYVVKHKSAKLFMTYNVGKLEAAPEIIGMDIESRTC